MRAVLGALIIGVSAGVLPGSLAAQDCGVGCAICGGWPYEHYEGIGYYEFGEYDMNCPSLVMSWCQNCLFAAAEGTVDQEALGRALAHSEVSELPALIAAYGERLLVADDRDLVAVRGNACSGNALGVWVRLSAEKAAALRSAGIASLDAVVGDGR